MPVPGQTFLVIVTYMLLYRICCIDAGLGGMFPFVLLMAYVLWPNVPVCAADDVFVRAQPQAGHHARYHHSHRLVRTHTCVHACTCRGTEIHTCVHTVIEGVWACQVLRPTVRCSIN